MKRPRVWTVRDFAVYAFSKDDEATRQRALRLLKRLNAKHRGKILIPSCGTNRSYTLFPATLARLEPDLFAPLDSVEGRIEELEDEVSELRAHLRRVVMQVGDNTRGLARIATRGGRP